MGTAGERTDAAPKLWCTCHKAISIMFSIGCYARPHSRQGHGGHPEHVRRCLAGHLWRSQDVSPVPFPALGGVSRQQKEMVRDVDSGPKASGSGGMLERSSRGEMQDWGQGADTSARTQGKFLNDHSTPGQVLGHWVLASHLRESFPHSSSSLRNVALCPKGHGPPLLACQPLKAEMEFLPCLQALGHPAVLASLLPRIQFRT